MKLERESLIPFAEPVHCGVPESAARFLHRQLDYDREVVGALLLNARHYAIGYTIAYVGTHKRASVEPRGVLIPALLTNAIAIILFHNHPCGDPTPSEEDIWWSHTVAGAGRVLKIEVVDHIVLGAPPAFTSISRLEGGLG